MEQKLELVCCLNNDEIRDVIPTLLLYLDSVTCVNNYSNRRKLLPKTVILDEDILREACAMGYEHVVEYMWPHFELRLQDKVKIPLVVSYIEDAVYTNQLCIVKYFINVFLSHKWTDSKLGFLFITFCAVNKLEVIKLFIKHIHKNDIELGLKFACTNKHYKICNYLTPLVGTCPRCFNIYHS